MRCGYSICERDSPVNIDERLEALTERLGRLTERQEALTHSVELLGQIQKDTDKQIRRLGRYVRLTILDHEARPLALEGENNEDDDHSAQRNG